MDKLKQNIYWIAVGAVALVLIALMVFLVFLPLGELQKARDELQTTSEKLGKAAKRDQDPKNPKQKIVTKDYKAELSRRKDALEAAKTALKSLVSFDPAIKADKIDLSRTYTNQFARKAKEKFKA